MKLVVPRLKVLLRLVVLGAALFFLATVLRHHWQQISAIRMTAPGVACLAIALGVTLFAHISAGWVWSQLLRQGFNQTVDRGWLIQAYLQTNIAKYLPGNIWHYYGRISAAKQAGATLEASAVSVLLEPLLTAAAALLVALLSGQIRSEAVESGIVHLKVMQQSGWWLGAVWLMLIATLISIHPVVLNPLLQRLARLKQVLPAAETTIAPSRLSRYPFMPLVGSLMFLLLRGTGFIITFWAIATCSVAQLPMLLSSFSLAWLLGLIVPGAPGGLGIFEAATIALLRDSFSPGLLLGVVALYRLISVIAEALGAALAWSDRRLARAEKQLNPPPP